MKKEQILKILITAIIATSLMLGFELLFDIPSISCWIINFVQSQPGWLIYLVIWIIMYLQVAIIPIPAVVVITAAIGARVLRTNLGLLMFLELDTWIFILVTMSAYMVGAITAYYIGKKFGKKAVIWCAGSEEDYNKWTQFISTKGKWPYAATVILPVFPDDLLCLVCGSVNFDFHFFFWSNLIGRTIGLITMLASLVIIGAGGNSPLAAIAWGGALIIELIAYLYIRFRGKNRDSF